METRTVVMPKVGEMMEEGTILEWLVEVGTEVELETPLVLINTDKVDYEVESPHAGRVSAVTAKEGDTLPVGAPLCEIEVAE